MVAMERITMTMRELDRFKVIQDVVDGKLKPWRAAERLKLTTRQIRRLAARLREHGPTGLVSGHRSRPGNRRLDTGVADRALTIIRDCYADFGPTLACEKLYECHGIRLAKETVRKLMTDAGLWVPRRQRPPKIYQPRARLNEDRRHRKLANLAVGLQWPRHSCSGNAPRRCPSSPQILTSTQRNRCAQSSDAGCSREYPRRSR